MSLAVRLNEFKLKDFVIIAANIVEEDRLNRISCEKKVVSLKFGIFIGF